MLRDELLYLYGSRQRAQSQITRLYPSVCEHAARLGDRRVVRAVRDDADLCASDLVDHRLRHDSPSKLKLLVEACQIVLPFIGALGVLCRGIVAAASCEICRQWMVG